MILVLDAIDPNGNTRRFATEIPTLESSFDFLSTLVSKGNILLKAYVKDGKQRYELPVEAFDGLPLAVGIHTLQEEWQAILTNAYSKNLIYEDQVWLATQWVKQCSSKIMYHQQMIIWARVGSQPNSFKKTTELAYYDGQLMYHQDQLVQAECRLSIRRNWLNQVTATSQQKG
ncbi:MAG: hypothetical protein EOO61_08685 [Hymenobacter sp.]|nr:MAG: hypothetical protein EOO61_08685 [Hymenobacter sp.]